MAEIVVGVDGSTSAGEALRWATHLARRRGWDVEAVLAWDTLDQRFADRKRRFRSDYVQADAEAALHRYVLDAVGPDGATDAERIAERAVAGPPVQVLLDASGDGAELLVVGSRGVGAVRTALLGSVSVDCAQLARCPVAIVRGLGQVDDVRPRRIVVGVDASASSRRALDWAIDEARSAGAQLAAVHVWHPSYIGAQPYAFTIEGLDAMEHNAREVLDRALAGADTEGLAELEPTVLEGPVSQRLLEAAKGADLVVVGSRGCGGFSGLLLGSVGLQLAHHAECPVVVAPSEAEDR
jgi:nucleotide-binding universal stress UspA family protein